MLKNEQLIQFLVENNGKPNEITWAELSKKFGFFREDLSSESNGDICRNIWRRYRKKGMKAHKAVEEKSSIGLLKSRWQSGSGQWLESYRFPLDQVPFDFDSLKESLLKEVKPCFKEIVHKSNDKALMCYTSDKHIGANTLSNSVYDNVYNEKTFNKRLDSLIKEMEDLYTEFGTFTDLYLIDLGDPIDGWNGQTTRGGHTLPQNMTSKEMFDVYVSSHKRLFDYLHTSPIANKIHFVAMTEDNHGGQFSYIVNRGLEIYLNCKYPEIETTVCDKFIHNMKVGQHTFMLCHGKDSADMKLGFPKKLDDKTETYINKYINHFNLTGNIHLVKGDLHQSATEYGQRFRYRNVMSMYGSSKWIHTNFGPTAAGVDYDIVYKNKNKVFEGRMIF